MKQVFLCNDTVTGIFSALYDAWKVCVHPSHPGTAGIMLRENMEQELFCEYTESIEQEAKAAAVEQLIRQHLGISVYEDIYYALHSEDPQKCNAVLGMMLTARSIPNSTRIMDHLSNADVRKVFELRRRVFHEAHHFTGFVRFRELYNGVLFSEIEPKNLILSCIAEHFADRFPLENWMIYDKTHQVFLVHESGKRWVMVHGEALHAETSRRLSDQEMQFEVLWKGFCTNISIDNRRNIKALKRQAAERFRRNMIEFQ